jgi:pimeloyl-ACP methyl ester carboxylesterase
MQLKKQEAGLVRVSGQLPILKYPNMIPTKTVSQELLPDVQFGMAKPPKPPKQPPAKKPSPFAQLPLPIRPLVKLVIYCYTHPKSMINMLNTVYPTAIRGKQKGPISEKHLPMFDPRTQVTFESADKTRLQGHWMPAVPASDRTIILGHGYFADWRSMLALADEFREKRYNVFLFDFRAHGKSDGEKTTFGYNEGKDIAGAVRFVSDQYPTESKNLFYYGHSMGAASMMMAQRSLQKHPQDLALLNQRVKGIVLDSGYSNFKEMIERFVNNIDSLERDSAVLKNLSKVAGVPIKKLFPALLDGIRKVGKDYTDIDVEIDEIRPAQLYTEAKPPQKPILVMHGTADRVINIKHGDITFETLKTHNINTRIEKIEGIDHITRKWAPLGSGQHFNSAYRSPEQANKAIQFFDAIKFGFSGGIKVLLPRK